MKRWLGMVLVCTGSFAACGDGGTGTGDVGDVDDVSDVSDVSDVGDVTTGDEGGVEGAGFGEPCCDTLHPTCDQPLPPCSPDFYCFVVPGGMYTSAGSCTVPCTDTCPDAGMNCMNSSAPTPSPRYCGFDCDTSLCGSPGPCTPGEAGCPPLLTCRNVMSSDYCLP